MTESWKLLEGQMVDGTFPLRQYLAGGEYHAVFLTEYGERKAVIKLVAGGSPGAERRLQQWKLAAKLSHPHLLQLFAVGSCQMEDAPVIYVVMEYADEDLSQVIPQRALTTEEAREMLGPALSALAYLHSQLLAHGHLKLSNIMAVGSSLKLSSDVGPDASPAGDVQALGMVLLEALTQQANPAEAGRLPAPFAEIVRNCLLGDPKSRWTLDTIASRLRPPARRWNYLWVAVLALILAAVVFGPKLLNRHPEPRPGPVVRTEEPHPEIPRVPAPSPAPVAPPPETKSPPAATPQPEPTRETTPPPVPEATATGVVQRVLPQVPHKALNTIHGIVKVSVRVEAGSDGSVSSAEIVSGGPSQYFAKLALDAARRWKFEPSPEPWILNFEFKNTGVTAAPSRAR